MTSPTPSEQPTLAADSSSDRPRPAVEGTLFAPAEGGVEPPNGAPSPALPDRIGRHHVLGVLGRGGMGTVFDAYDPQLDRRLAIKVLQHGTVQRRTDLLAEAQAMAKISHPNVVHVYDVGTYEDQVFVAMERLEGGTLAAWVANTKPTWREILQVYIEAGRGLGAAHDAGLVHRDFKPDNVMLDDLRRPCVLDFGIAQAIAGGSKRSDGPLNATTEALAATVAAPSGRIVGTPAYMAPEQFEGRSAEARTDQFSFCVALYEALSGKRPFAGETIAELASAVLERPPTPLPATAGVPRHVARALQRGLSKNPASRYASMDELLRDLARNPARTRRTVGGLVGLGLIAGLVGALASRVGTSETPCAGAASELEDVFDDTRAANVEAALVATELPYARETAERVRRDLQDYAGAWVEQRTDACEATVVRHEQSEAAMDLRMACLQRARQALGATVDVLAEADAGVTERAQPMVESLPELERCARIDALMTETPAPPDELVEEVDGVRAELAKAKAAELAGRYERALELADAAQQRANKLDYGPLVSEVALALASAERLNLHHEASEKWADEAIESATRWGQWSVVFDASVIAMVSVGSSLSQRDAGMKYAVYAKGLADRTSSGKSRAEFNSAFAAILRADAQYAEADAYYRRAVDELATVTGESSVATAVAELNLATNLKKLGKYDDAARRYEHAREVLSEHYGTRHPKVISTRWLLAEVHTLRGEFDLAEREHRWVLERRIETIGVQGPDVMRSHLGLASVLTQKGKHESAEAESRRAIEAFDGSKGARGLLATAYNNLGNALELQGQLAEAADAQLKAIELHTARSGADHPSVGISHSALGLIRQKQGDFTLAEQDQRAALEILEAKLGSDHPTTANVRSNLGLALEGQGQIEAALEIQRQALANSLAALGEEHPQTREIAEIVARLSAR